MSLKGILNTLALGTSLLISNYVLALEIAPYKSSSFSPSQGEKFRVVLTGLKADTQGQLDLYSGDQDLITSLSFIAKQDKTIVMWDGKDLDGQQVPDEAYSPVVRYTEDDIEKVADFRQTSGGEELESFEKNIEDGRIEYTLPADARVLIRAGIKQGPMLRSVVDWHPRAAGFHAERWNGFDQDNVFNIAHDLGVGYLIAAYTLPSHSIITYGNTSEDYRTYRERKGWALPKMPLGMVQLSREGRRLSREYFQPLLQQRSPRITVKMTEPAGNREIREIKHLDEIVTLVDLHPDDEQYLDQSRYEVSFFVDNRFLAEEEQGYVPLRWKWSPSRFGLKPGKHILTVNISGYEGQVGVKNIEFNIVDNQQN